MVRALADEGQTMETSNGIDFVGEARVHIALEVADLERSTAFYRVLLDAEPVKRRPGYAKFEPAAPSLNLSLNEGVGGPGLRAGGAGHFGLQVRTTEAVLEAARRLRRAGLAVREELGTACCYAEQDKVWVDDPDGNPWEVFVVTGESQQRAPTGAQDETDACCAPTCCAPASKDAPR
jgi:catechol 2,3-dioxygenase-like lactoylglutathione lyase family enzyme